MTSPVFRNTSRCKRDLLYNNDNQRRNGSEGMLHRELLKREAENNPILVAGGGQGWMGHSLARQMGCTPGMQLVALVNPDPQAARAMFIDTGLTPDSIVEADSPGPAIDAIRAGKRVVTAAFALPAQLEMVDVVVDAGWSPAWAAQTAYHAIRHGKDVVLYNIETDVTVGRILKKMAVQAGVIYSVATGDEPGCLMELYDFVRTLGLEVIAIGKAKNTPFEPGATPQTVAETAQKTGLDPYQLAFWADGTKTMLEMACAANATGYGPMQRGMVGPSATPETVSQIFALKEDGGIVRFPGVVDYVQGDALAGGVFITVRVRDPRQRAELRYLKGWNGDYFTFTRPYHLGVVETPISIARVCLHRQATLVPLDQPVAEVMAVAKRDLLPGDILDDLGGFCAYGEIDQDDVARELRALPVGLVPGARMVRKLAAGQIISWDDVSLDEDSIVVKLRREQDRGIV
jgi:predicted homoserine dehydrogenase-like protein